MLTNLGFVGCRVKSSLHMTYLSNSIARSVSLRFLQITTISSAYLTRRPTSAPFLSHHVSSAFKYMFANNGEMTPPYDEIDVMPRYIQYS